MPKSITIQKKQSIPESNDYQLLRQKGLEYIQQLGSKLWTDYNIHDPGITILEALSYALTDLGYRTSLDIKDLLAMPEYGNPDSDGQYAADKRQAFFTARDILTVNPWTTDDFRKLLINIDGIKNGWLKNLICPCDGIYLFANCDKSILQFEPTDKKVILKGLYDVLLEFEDEEKSGNLNSGKIKYNFSFPNGSRRADASIEMRLPSWAKLENDKAKYKLFRKPDSKITQVKIPFISGNKTDQADIPATPETLFDNALRKPMFADIEVTFKPDKSLPATTKLIFEFVPLTVWFRNTEERRALLLDDLRLALQDSTAAGIIPKYQEKIKIADEIIEKTIFELNNHRNLCEDFCSIKAIEVEDIGICMDMDVEPSADIEAILGEAFYLIDQYFNPDIKFYSLQQLLDEKISVDEIFEGPALKNGFIKNEELASASLRSMLYTSDIINILMDISGIKSIKNFAFSKYDDEGKQIERQPWAMSVTTNRQPRLYIEATKVLVFKNELPFLADNTELLNTLQVIKGRHIQSKFSVLSNDFPVPHGNYFDLSAYFPVQDSLPFTYGTGYDGLPDSASELRKAQAKQLKAYLLFFEQLLVNYLAQLSSIKDLFAVDETVQHSYFSRLIESSEIVGINDLYNGLDANALQELTESNDTFLERRNRFLDHLLARFSETFNEYALILYSYTEDKDLADEQLIDNKISFIRNFPEISRNRAKSINYKADSAVVCTNKNMAGLAKRIQLLLGYDHTVSDEIKTGEQIFILEHILLRPRYLWKNFELYEEFDFDNKNYERRWRLTDGEQIYLSSSTRYYDKEISKANRKARYEIGAVIDYMTNKDNYQVKKEKKWFVNLLNEDGEVIAYRQQHFKTKLDAENARDQIISFAKTNVLTDPLLPVCLPNDCKKFCGEEDPYSFRFTVVLNGEEGLANKGMEFRRFAEQTIRMESPAHLGLKICWVSKKQLAEFQTVYCDWLTEIAKPEPDPNALHNKLAALLSVFQKLKNVYPQAALFDCRDGNDENRVILGYTAIISDEELDKQIKKEKTD